MHGRDLIPALTLAFLVTTGIAAGRLLPQGDMPVLVHVGSSGLANAFQKPGMADVLLVGLPAPGFAILKGNAAKIRAALGLTISWQGRVPCLSAS